jgi:cytochrome c-type biogenesis protein CcmH/NrfF
MKLLKKRRAALIGWAFFLNLGLVLSGCGAQLSTSDTCRELRALEQSTPSNPSEAERHRIVDGVGSLAARSSDALKSDMQVLAKFMRDDPDELYRGKSQQQVQDWLNERKSSYERITAICQRG